MVYWQMRPVSTSANIPHCVTGSCKWFTPETCRQHFACSYFLPSLLQFHCSSTLYICGPFAAVLRVVCSRIWCNIFCRIQTITVHLRSVKEQERCSLQCPAITYRPNEVPWHQLTCDVRWTNLFFTAFAVLSKGPFLNTFLQDSQLPTFVILYLRCK